MSAVSAFIRDCLWLLWMVFFRPRSFRQEAEQYDRRQQWRLTTQALVATGVASFAFVVLTGLLLQVGGFSFDFTRGLSGVASGVVFGVASGVGYFRLFLFPIETLTSLWALVQARRFPQKAVRWLHLSLAYWEEVMLLPQPFLTSLLVAVGKQNREELLKAVTHLTANTFQRRSAMNALLEMTRRDLLRRHSLNEIAQVQQQLGWLTPHLRIVHGIELSGRVDSEGSLHLVKLWGAKGEESNWTGSSSKQTPNTTSSDPDTVTAEKIPRGILSVDAIEAFRAGGAQNAIGLCQQISAEVAAAVSTTSNYQKLAGLNRTRRQLDELRQFAVLRLHRREAQIFSQVAQQWLNAVTAELDRLTEEERIAERLPNPYVAPRPLSPERDSIFIGRTDVFRFFEEHFLRADQNVPIVLHGQPRIGKSSLLRHCSTRLSTDLLPVYVDMQRSAQVESTHGLLFNLADIISQALTSRGGVLRLHHC